MKKRIMFLVTLLVLLLSSCTQPSNSEDTLGFSEGWWTFRQYLNGYPGDDGTGYSSSYYIKYDRNKAIERIGNDDEFGGIMSGYEESFAWDELFKQKMAGSYFQKSLETELPKWCIFDKSISEPFSEGWWAFRKYFDDNGDSKNTSSYYSSIYYIKYDRNKALERIGNEEAESSTISGFEEPFAWDELFKQKKDGSYFQKWPETKLPEWCTMDKVSNMRE